MVGLHCRREGVDGSPRHECEAPKRISRQPSRITSPATSACSMRVVIRHPRLYHLPMIDWSSCAAVERDPAVLSGAWVFRGTRVPVAALFENLEDDASVHQFVEWFPGVCVAQARAVLEHAASSSIAVP